MWRENVESRDLFFRANSPEVCRRAFTETIKYDRVRARNNKVDRCGSFVYLLSARIHSVVVNQLAYRIRPSGLATQSDCTAGETLPNSACSFSICVDREDGSRLQRRKIYTQWATKSTYTSILDYNFRVSWWTFTLL